MERTDELKQGELILYKTPEGTVRVEVAYEEETFWLNQRKMAELFGVDVRTVNEHLQNIYASGELTPRPTIRKIRIVQKEGNRDIARDIEFYNLDVIISVGYRVNSVQATRFRIWATQTLREFITKGFVLDDERLKLNKRFGKDYFDELLERIREIRASELIIKRNMHRSPPLAALTTERVPCACFVESQRLESEIRLCTQKATYSYLRRTASLRRSSRNLRVTGAGLGWSAIRIRLAGGRCIIRSCFGRRRGWSMPV